MANLAIAARGRSLVLAPIGLTALLLAGCAQTQDASTQPTQAFNTDGVFPISIVNNSDTTMTFVGDSPADIFAIATPEFRSVPAGQTFTTTVTLNTSAIQQSGNSGAGANYDYQQMSVSVWWDSDSTKISGGCMGDNVTYTYVAGQLTCTLS